MGHQKKISIVTISFNQGEFLEECIQSVINQDYENIEYIVVDPGSTDESRSIIEKYKDKIDVVILDPDKGPADGLNKGFDAATGEIYSYINADDKFMPGAFQFVNDFFNDSPDVDVLTAAIRIIDEFGNVLTRKRTSDVFKVEDYAARICTIGQQGTFFRAEAFKAAGGFNVENRIAWDGELLVDMYLQNKKFKKIDKLLGDFRVYSESITGSNLHYDKWIADHERISKKIETHGYKAYSPLMSKIKRILYKVSPLRHLSYYTVK